MLLPSQLASMMSAALAQLGGPTLDLRDLRPDPAALALPGGSHGWAWLGSILFGLLTVVTTLLLQKKTTPELLTPANARHGFDDPEPGQPGGAPSA
jgi:hypothetical protein